MAIAIPSALRRRVPPRAYRLIAGRGKRWHETKTPGSHGAPIGRTDQAQGRTPDGPGAGTGFATSMGPHDSLTALMLTRSLSKRDYDHIVQVIDRWWGGPTSALAHPLFHYELGELARVVEHDGILVGFLFGFIAPGPPRTGYVHLVGIHPDFRRRGVATVLYQAFEEDCRQAQCIELKAITTLGNDASVEFHEATGWEKSTVDDYAGPGRARIVLRKTLSAARVGDE